MVIRTVSKRRTYYISCIMERFSHVVLHDNGDETPSDTVAAFRALLAHPDAKFREHWEDEYTVVKYVVDISPTLSYTLTEPSPVQAVELEPERPAKALDPDEEWVTPRWV